MESVAPSTSSSSSSLELECPANSSSSSCMSSDQYSVLSDGHREMCSEYRPKALEEIIGQDMIIKALSNAIKLNRISPLYLFHGPNGTGKTSVARLFAMSLLCESPSAASPMTPCWSCTACSNSFYYTNQVLQGSFSDIIHAASSPSSGYKVFVIDDELSLSNAESWQQWGELLLNTNQVLDQEKGCDSVVFVLVVEDASVVPRAVSSRCQKFRFSRLRDTDVMFKLSKIAAREQIEAGPDALKLIVRKADGNMREAENLINQLLLFESNITASMAQQIAGLVPRDELVCLLEAAASEDCPASVRYVRDLIAAGIEPRALISQLASLITEHLADSCSSIKGQQPETLSRALRVLIETEKQLLMFPCNHTTWVTDAILQIASTCGAQRIQTDRKTDTIGAGEMQSMRFEEHDDNSRKREQPQFNNTTAQYLSRSICNPGTDIRSLDTDELWHNILEGIQNETVRDFLRCRGKLISFTVSRANAIVHLMLKQQEEIKEDTIAVALRTSFGCPVTLNISRIPIQEVTAETFADRVSYRTHSDRIIRSSLRSAESGNNVQMTRQGTDQEVGRAQSCREPLLSNRSTQEARNPTFKDLKMTSSGRDRCSGISSTAKSAALNKLSLLPESSMPQTDISIEPYSQDLLFEEANIDRHPGQRFSKLTKGFVKPKQHRSCIHRGLNRSWSCTDKFCRAENKVNKAIMGSNKQVSAKMSISLER